MMQSRWDWRRAAPGGGVEDDDEGRDEVTNSRVSDLQCGSGFAEWGAVAGRTRLRPGKDALRGRVRGRRTTTKDEGRDDDEMTIHEPAWKGVCGHNADRFSMALLWSLARFCVVGF